MDDVTRIMDAYRECVRHVWNSCFADEARRSPDWESIDDFGAASALLFRALVLRRLGQAESACTPVDESGEPLLFLRVDLDPRGEILINRERSSGYWDHPLTSVQKGELDLAFLSYFDWSVVDHRDFAYYRVRITGSANHPAVVGKDALVPIAPHVHVFFEGSAAGG